MIRIVLVVLGLLAAAYLVIRIVRDARDANLDWRGVGIAVALMMLAIYLRHATDIGGLV